ncbi:tetratricopeptide repeat protein [Candidatus Poribacteria bacterium]|nr:tetratricopeptide repeat protein [Candidatus Poribacteria bacterium]
MTPIILLTISIFSTNAYISSSLPPANPLLLSVNSPREIIVIEHHCSSTSISPGESSDSQLLYADALFDENDFDAAILEFKRYIFYNPQSDVLDYALYRIGQSHYYSHRPADAQKTLERLLKEYPQSPFRLYARFMLGKTFMDNENFTRARNEFDIITQSNEDKKLSAQAQYLQAWSYLSARDWYSAIAEFRKVGQFQTDSPFSIKAERLADTTLAGIRLPRKSPTLARWMSTFLPGSGQIYAGKITNGLISTAFNAAFIYLLADSIHDKRYVDTVGIYMIGARFYWGNIYNAAQSALEYNRRLEDRLLEGIIAADYQTTLIDK